MGLYIALKFVAYSAWCAVGLGLFGTQGRALPVRALGFGAVRTALGAGFGFVLFFVAGALPIHGTLRDYILIYAPVRVVEWGILWMMMRRPGGPALASPRVLVWILIGIAVSFAADLASPIPPGERFCIGRCLC